VLITGPKGTAFQQGFTDFTPELALLGSGGLDGRYGAGPSLTIRYYMDVITLGTLVGYINILSTSQPMTLKLSK
jgi:hypothetical protein